MLFTVFGVVTGIVILWVTDVFLVSLMELAVDMTVELVATEESVKFGVVLQIDDVVTAGCWWCCCWAFCPAYTPPVAVVAAAPPGKEFVCSYGTSDLNGCPGIWGIGPCRLGPCCDGGHGCCCGIG